MAVAAGGNIGDRPAAGEDGLVAVRVGSVGLDGQAGEPLPDALRLLAQERLAPDEVALVEAHEALEARLERGVVGRHVRAPEAVRLFEPQRLERPVAEVHEAERLARLEEEVVERALVGERLVQLGAVLADIGPPQREQRYRADAEVSRTEEGKRL